MQHDVYPTLLTMAQIKDVRRQHSRTFLDSESVLTADDQGECRSHRERDEVVYKYDYSYLALPDKHVFSDGSRRSCTSRYALSKQPVKETRLS